MRGPTELFKDAWALFSNHATLFLSIYAIPAVLTLVYGFFIALVSAPDFAEQFALVVLPFTVALTAVLVVVSVISGVALIKAVSAPEETTLATAYKFGLEQLWSYLWVSILVGLTILVGFVLFIIPGIIFVIWYSFSYFTLVLEGKRGTEAMKASRAYVKGRWWAVFGRMFALFIVIMLAAMLLGVLLQMLVPVSKEMMDAIASISNIVLVPFSIAYTYLMYTDVRRMTEASANAVATPGAAPTV